MQQSPGCQPSGPQINTRATRHTLSLPRKSGFTGPPAGPASLLCGSPEGTLCLALQVLAALRKVGRPQPCSSTATCRDKQAASPPARPPGAVPPGNGTSSLGSSRGLLDSLQSGRAGGREQVGRPAWVSSLEPLAGLIHYASVFTVAMAFQAVAQTIQKTQLLRSLWSHIFPLRAARKSLPEHASVRLPPRVQCRSGGILVTNIRHVPCSSPGRVTALSFNRPCSSSCPSHTAVLALVQPAQFLTLSPTCLSLFPSFKIK